MLDLKKKYFKFIKKQEISSEIFYDKSQQLKKFYLPFCYQIYKLYKTKNKSLLIGLSGGQGSG